MEVVRFAILGLGAGAVYGLTAQGVVLTYRGSGVVNFAHGAVGMVGAYIFYILRDDGMTTALAFLLAVGFGATFGACTHLLVMRPLRAAPALSRLVATLGLFVTLLAFGEREWGQAPRIIGKLLPVDSVTLFSDILVGQDRLIILGVGVLVTALLTAMATRTRFGLSTAAVSQSRQAAETLAISPDVVAMINWALGGVLAVVGAILIVNLTGLQVDGLVLLIIPALAAALVGGFRSYILTFAGGLAIGVMEAEIAYLQVRLGPDVRLDGWARSIPFLVIVVVLVARGRALPLRGDVAERAPELGSGRVRFRWVVLVAGAALALTLVASDAWADAIAVTVAIGLITLSVVIVTGYAGQLSLAQFGLAGMGGWIAAQLVANHGVPFELAFVLGVVGTVPIGILVGLPALRTRGVNLAIATLGLALLLESQILANQARTGGSSGLRVGSPSIFGLDLDTFAHPSRYAAFSLILLTIAGILVANLRSSRTGRSLIAVRTNERAAAALGINVFGSKLYAFGLSAAFAAAGGVLLSFRRPTAVFFPAFSVFESIFAVVYAVIGGVGSAVGAVLGALLSPGGVGVKLSETLGSDPQSLFTMFTGILLIVILIVDPNGLVSLCARALRRMRQSLGRDAAPARPIDLPDVAGRPDVHPAVLEIDDISVRYGGVTALDHVSLVVRPGEVVGLIGPNGAGKTSLIDAVTGFASLTSGRVAIDGRDVSRWSPRRRAKAGLARSFQSLELFDSLTVAENIQTACEHRTLGSYAGDMFRPDDAVLTPTAVAAIHEFGLADELVRRPDQLSYGHRRLVAIARAIAAAPSILLLDEPAAGLDANERAELGHLVRRLATEWGLAVLVVEHDIALVLSMCDRVAVLVDGSKITDGQPEEVARDRAVIESYLGATAAKDHAPRAGEERVTTTVSVLPRSEPAGQNGDDQSPLVAAARLSAGYGSLAAIRDIDLVVRPGEVVALLGANGAGKTTTLLALAGELPPLEGEVSLFGEQGPVPLHRGARRGLGFLTEESPIINSLSVDANLRLGQGPPEDAFGMFPELRPLRSRSAGLLSGGEQQMLALARILASRPRLLFVDELSLGLAPMIVERLLVAVRAAADQGVGVIIVEQHLRLALDTADRAYVLHRGRVVMERTSRDTEDLDAIERVLLYGV